MRLGDWIDDAHLSDAAIRAHGAAFRDGAGRAVVLDGILKLGKLAALRRLFAGDGRFEQVFGLFDRSPHGVTAKEYAAADPANRFYTYRNLIGPTQAMAPGFLAHLLFVKLTESPEWLDWLGAIAGADLPARTAMHARIMSDGLSMKPHDDRGHGALCAVLYLSEGWSPSFGGHFEQTLPEGGAFDVAPLANRMILFAPESGLPHGVAPFTPEIGGWERWSYSLWYGAGTEGADPH